PSRAHVAWLPDALAGWLFLRCSGLLRDLHFPYTTLFRSDGEAVAYALYNLEDRGPLMIGPQTRVYQGMIVGEHSRENDLDVNVLKGKKLTNIRAAGKDDNVLLTPPMKMTLERALSYIADDELVEVTPKSIRLGKRWLDPNMRKKMERLKDAQAVA